MKGLAEVLDGERLRNLLKAFAYRLYLCSGYVPVRDRVLCFLGRSRAVVVYYHRIGDDRDPLTRSATDFRNDLEYLRRHYLCLGFADLCERMRANVPLRKPLAAVTFDDGYRDNFQIAVPILKDLGLTATFFVATGFIGTDREFPHDLRAAAREGRPLCRYAKLTWEDLRAMEESGFEIGSHTVEHTDLGKTDGPTIEREIRDSLATLNRELGERPRAFSFPWGQPENIPCEALPALREAGYYAAASAYGGINGRGTDLLRICRVDMGNGEFDRWVARARIAGFDPDQVRARRSARSAPAEQYRAPLL